METAAVAREAGVVAGRLGLPGNDPEVLKGRAGDLAFWLELRALYGECWARVRDLYRTRTSSRP